MSINLQKGQKINLEKGDGSGGAPTKLMMGLGWDAANGRSSIDLDASCVLIDDQKRVVDTVYFGTSGLQSKCGSVRHSGDNLTGKGEGDDEKIWVNLQQIPANVQSVVFTINSFQGQNFHDVENCFARLVDEDSKKELCIFKLNEKGSNTAMVMAKVYRHQGSWKLAALGIPANGRTVMDITNSVIAQL